jgi:AcrR family transcriptional regulator
MKLAILASARKEFLRAGFQGANMRAVAKKAGCSLSNLYNYFDSKDDIFTSVLAPCLSEIEMALDWTGKVRPPNRAYMLSLEEERKYYKLTIDYIDSHRDDLKLLLLKSQGSSLENYPQHVADRYHQNILSYIDYLKTKFPENNGYDMSEFFIRSICFSYISCIIEFLTHDFSRTEMLRYWEEMTIYSNQGFLGLIKR